MFKAKTPTLSDEVSIYLSLYLLSRCNIYENYSVMKRWIGIIQLF